LRLSRNFGHHVAVTAGLDHARGDCVVLMDADLQDQPEFIPTLLAKMSAGFDVVYAIRQERRDTLFKRVTAALFWKIIRRLSGIDITPNQAALRVMSRRYVEALKSIRERSRFLAGIMTWVGFRQIGIAVPHAERFAGKTKYGMWKLIKLTLNAVCAFSYLPLQLATYFGFTISFLAVTYSIVLVIQKLMYGLAPGFASLMVGILFMGGVQLITIGILGEYIGRIFSESQQRPLYFIEADLNGNK
jgi:dolichol-phosphate mannosyltransferase